LDRISRDVFLRYLQFTTAMFLMLLVVESMAQIVGVLIKVTR